MAGCQVPEVTLWHMTGQNATVLRTTAKTDARLGCDLLNALGVARQMTEPWILYRFDEGEGDVANDASGKALHGKIHGAKWVK